MISSLRRPVSQKSHVLAAVAFGRREHNVVAAEPNLKAGDELAVDVEKRQAAKHGAAPLARRGQLRSAPGVEDFVLMRPDGDLWQPGGAAGAEVGAHRVGRGRGREDEPVARLRLHGFGQPDDLDTGERGEGEARRSRFCSWSVDRRVRQRDDLEIGQAIKGGRELGHDVEARHCRKRDHRTRAGGFHESGDLDRLQVGIDREDGAGGLAAPDDEVRLRQIRQHERNRALGRHAERVKRVRRARDLSEKFR